MCYVQAINDEALAFQREKQGRLNQVEVVLLLRLHQIEYLQDGQLPSDLSGALLFSTAELDKLKRRVHVSSGFATLVVNGCVGCGWVKSGCHCRLLSFVCLSVCLSGAQLVTQSANLLPGAGHDEYAQAQLRKA